MIKLKVKKISEDLFKRVKKLLIKKFATLLRVSEDRITIELKKPAAASKTASRRLLLMPLNELEESGDSQADQSEIDVTLKDGETSKPETTDTATAAKQLQDMKPDELQEKLTEGNGDETKELQNSLNSLVVKSIKEVPIELTPPSSPAAMPQVTLATVGLAVVLAALAV